MSDDQKRNWGFTFTEAPLPCILVADEEAGRPYPATMRVMDQHGNVRKIPGHIKWHDGEQVIAFDEEGRL